MRRFPVHVTTIWSYSAEYNGAIYCLGAHSGTEGVVNAAFHLQQDEAERLYRELGQQLKAHSPKQEKSA